MTKKKKQLRLLAALLIVAVLGIIYVLVKKADWENESGEETVQLVIVDLPSAEISAVKLENTKGTLLLSYDGEIWKSEDEPETELNQDAVSSLMNRLNPLDAVRELSEVPEDLEAYGLENPVITISVAKQDGDEVQIYLGADSADGNIYLMTSESEKVYTADSYLLTAFDCTLDDLEALEETEEDAE